MRLPVAKCISTLFFMVIAATSYGKDFPMLHYTIENGLPGNTVYAVYRDRYDFLWFATDKGIARYNGIEFEKFTTSDGLPDNDVFLIQGDYDGRLWTNCFNSKLCYYSYKDGRFHNEDNTPFLKTDFVHSFITKIEVEQDSSITFLFVDNPNILNIHGNKVTSFCLKEDMAREFVYPGILSVRKLSANRYLLHLPRSYAYIVDTGGNVIEKRKYKNEQYESTLFQNQKYLFTHNGIYSTDEELLLKFTNKDLIKANIYRILKFDNNWFIGTNVGLFINNELQILKGQRISSINRDIEGNYWISSLNSGVYYLAKDFLNTEQYDDVYSGRIEYATAIGKYLFFTTSNRNLYRLSGHGPVLLFDYYKHFAKLYSGIEDWKNFSNGSYNYGKLIDGKYRYYYLDHLASAVIDGVNTDHIVVHSYEKSPMLGHIKELVSDNENIVLRNTNSVYTIDKAHLASNGKIDVKNIVEFSLNKRIVAIAVDTQSGIWFSTFDTVYKIAGGIAKPQAQFGKCALKCMQIVGKYMIAISDKNQLIVFNNFGAGIKDTSIRGANCIWGQLYKLNDSTFLVSTDNQYRLLKLYPSADVPKIRVQIIENTSLPEQAEYICSNDSFCYFFKKGSVTLVPISNLYINHLTPEIFYKSLKTRDTSYPITPGAEIKISYNSSRNINISFAPFSFGSKYIICEYSISRDTVDYWRRVRNNEINLFDPGYGGYIVKVKAKTLSGDYFSAPFVFRFTILKPFWATWWFILLSGSVILIAVSLIFLAIIAQRTRKREIKHENEIKFLRSEYKALNALMNPHFIFNTLNNVQWLVNNGDKTAANHYLRIFSDLIRQNMHNISKELIPMGNEIELINNYLKLEKLRFKEALNYEINIEGDIDLDCIKIPPLLIQPLVENAIKHGLLPGVKAYNLLSVNIYRGHDKLYIDITDNGIGINESQKRTRSLHKSTGLDNIRNRIGKLSLMHDIYIDLSITELHNKDGKPEGTLARISIDMPEE